MVTQIICPFNEWSTVHHSGVQILFYGKPDTPSSTNQINMTIRRRSQWSICIKLVVPTSSQSQWQPENARSRNQRRLMRVGRSWNCSFQSGVVNPGKVKIFVGFFGVVMYLRYLALCFCWELSITFKGPLSPENPPPENPWEKRRPKNEKGRLFTLLGCPWKLVT